MATAMRNAQPHRIAAMLLAGLALLATTAVAQQYKRVHQEALRPLLDGKLDAASESIGAVCRERGDDPESWFLAALLAAVQDDAAAARDAVARALDLGLPPGRFLAGPFECTAKLRAIPGLAADLEARSGPLVHGPTLGDVTHEHARVWLRTARPARVSIEARSDAGHVAHIDGRTTSRSAHTATLQLDGLRANTSYSYRVLVEGADTEHGGRIRTAPAPGTPTTFTIAFGGGAGYVPQHEHMWNTIRATAPDALLLLGDNVYSDDPTRRGMQEYCYSRRQSRPEWRALVHSVPVYAIWDDHDFGTNDCIGGTSRTTPPWKPEVWEVFTRNWPNPDYGHADRPDGIGSYFTWQRGDVRFVELDGRAWRTDPRQPEPTMLGPAQHAWLDATLGNSQCRVHAICSPVPWTFAAKGDSRDTWNGFRAERDGLFASWRAMEVPGVVLLSADRHRSDAWRIDRAEGPDLYEFNSSRLTNQHRHGPVPGSLFSYTAGPSFGLVTFDTAGADTPRVTYRVVDLQGTIQHSLAIRPGAE